MHFKSAYLWTVWQRNRLKRRTEVGVVLSSALLQNFVQKTVLPAGIPRKATFASAENPRPISPRREPDLDHLSTLIAEECSYTKGPFCSFGSRSANPCFKQMSGSEGCHHEFRISQTNSHCIAALLTSCAAIALSRSSAN